MSGKPHPSNPILIVDDEAAILLSIDTALQMAGLSNTLTCQDSRRVMDLLARLRGLGVEVERMPDPDAEDA